jgi:hypothetical protein
MIRSLFLTALIFSSFDASAFVPELMLSCGQIGIEEVELGKFRYITSVGAIVDGASIEQLVNLSAVKVNNECQITMKLLRNNYQAKFYFNKNGSKLKGKINVAQFDYGAEENCEMTPRYYSTLGECKIPTKDNQTRFKSVESFQVAPPTLELKMNTPLEINASGRGAKEVHPGDKINSSNSKTDPK